MSITKRENLCSTMWIALSAILHWIDVDLHDFRPRKNLSSFSINFLECLVLFVVNIKFKLILRILKCSCYLEKSHLKAILLSMIINILKLFNQLFSRMMEFLFFWYFDFIKNTSLIKIAVFKFFLKYKLIEWMMSYQV